MGIGKLKNQVAMVTGGSTGIGEAIVKELHEAGMKVVIVDIKKKNADESKENTAFLEFDLLQISSLNKVIEFTNETFGGVDLLVNCAGIYPSKPALQVEENEWDQVIDLNLKAPFFLSQLVAGEMIRNNTGGSIINVASTAATMPRPGISHYATSKAGLVMLTRVLAIEWASSNIRVNAICPGVVETDTLTSSLTTERLQNEHKEKISKIPLSRAALPTEIAKSVLYLADEDYSGYITGQSIYIDGGYTSGQMFATFNE